MEIESSKLKWYYDKPKFDDIIGKRVIVITKSGSIFSVAYAGCDREPFCDDFENMIRYAIIDTSEEPLPLDGIYPIINECGDNWFARCDNKNVFSYIVYGETEVKAIANWNGFVRRLK